MCSENDKNKKLLWEDIHVSKKKRRVKEGGQKSIIKPGIQVS